MKDQLLVWLHRIPAAGYAYGLLAAAVVSGFVGFVHYEREVGKRDLLIAQAEQTNVTLRHAADSLSKVYRVDTLRLTKIRQVTESLTVTVEKWKRDTLKVVEYVTRADSTIKVCTQALQTCEQRVGVAQRGWDNARAENALLKKNYPSAAKPWVYGALGVATGYLVRALTK